MDRTQRTHLQPLEQTTADFTNAASRINLPSPAWLALLAEETTEVSQDGLRQLVDVAPSGGRAKDIFAVEAVEDKVCMHRVGWREVRVEGEQVEQWGEKSGKSTSREMEQLA
jgi:hypothetical protein